MLFFRFFIQFDMMPKNDKLILFFLVKLRDLEILFMALLIFQIVIPSKAVKNEKIMETLLVQANSGMYREHEMYFEACKEKLQKQDSRFSSEWESFDMALFPKDPNFKDLGKFQNDSF